MCVCGGGGGGRAKGMLDPFQYYLGGAGGGRDLFFLELTKSPSENEFCFLGRVGGRGCWERGMGVKQFSFR